MKSVLLRRQNLLIVAFFFVVALVVYGQSLGNDFVNFDDNYLVFQNRAIRTITPSSLKFIFTTYDPELYIPLTLFSYQIDHLIGGLNATTFHLTNLILHTLNALLVMWIVGLLYRKRWIAVLLGLLFLAHPLNTESVAWVSGRKDVLSTLFFLLALGSYLRFREGNDKKWITRSLVAFTIGLFAKVMVATLPVILILIDWKDGKRIDKKNLKEKIPYFVLSAVFIVIALFGKQTALSNSPLWQSKLMACKSIAFYIGKFFLPTNLSVVYPYTNPITLSSPDFYIPVLVVLVIAALAIASIKRTKEILFGILFMIITLAPTFTNYAKGGDIYFASDRYFYIPIIGLIFVLAHLLAKYSDVDQRRKGKICVLGGLILVLAMIGTWQRSLVWKDTETLMRDALAKYPNSQVAHTLIGAIQAERGDMEKAGQSYKKSLDIRENERALYNMGVIYLQEDRLNEALAVNQRAVEINPYYAPAHFNVGYLKWNLGKIDEAIIHFEKAIKYNPFDVDARINLAAIVVKRGDYDRARKLMKEALVLDPKNADVKLILETVQ